VQLVFGESDEQMKLSPLYTVVEKYLLTLLNVESFANEVRELKNRAILACKKTKMQ
jgi:hypothetical protein